MPQATRIGIPMQPHDRPCDLPADYQRTLRNEFHVRYLESLGASATPANLALVNKHLPMEQCKITTAWKSRGWIADYVYISPEMSAPAPAPHASASAPHSSTILSALLDQKVADAAGEADAARDQRAALHAPTGGMAFAEAQHKFLYPFKPPRADAAGGSPPRASPRRSPRRSIAPAAPRDDDSEGGDGSDSDDCGGRASAGDASAADGERRDFGTRDPHRFQVYTEEEIIAELAPLLQLHTKDVVALQAEFVKDFPFERLRSRMDEADVRHAIGELSRQRTTRFIGLLGLFLYWSFLADAAGHEVQPEQLSSLYCAVHRYFFTVRERCAVPRGRSRPIESAAAIGFRAHAARASRSCHRMKKRRTQLLFVLPLLLMLARYAVEALIRQAFPKWWTTIDGRDTLARMDAAIEQMFDPNGHHSHISCLESTSDAIRLAARDALGVKYRSRQVCADDDRVAVCARSDGCH